MGRDFYERSPAARAVLDQAESCMPGLLSLCFEGPMEALTRTDVAQAALFAVEAACAAAAAEAGLRPDALAGFSLGEWTACHASGMLPFDEAFSLVRHRGEWMQACAQKHPGGMMAVMRPEGETLAALLAQHPKVSPANYNAPGQTVVAGPAQALDAFEVAVKAASGRGIRLNVGGAFHTDAMKGVGEQLFSVLSKTRLVRPAVPVYANLTGLPYTPRSTAQTLSAQAFSPVRWADTLRNMAADGVTDYFELGPGTVLTGLIRKNLPDVRTYQAEDAEGLRKAAAELGRNA